MSKQQKKNLFRGKNVKVKNLKAHKLFKKLFVTQKETL